MGAVSNPLVRGPWALGVDVTSLRPGTDKSCSISPGVAAGTPRQQANQNIVRARLVQRERPATSPARDTEAAKGGGQQTTNHRPNAHRSSCAATLPPATMSAAAVKPDAAKATVQTRATTDSTDGRSRSTATLRAWKTRAFCRQ